MVELLIQSDVLECWRRANKDFEQNRFDGPSTGQATIFRDRKSLLCLAAVHAVNHYKGAKNEDRKGADLFTGGLVRTLGAMSKASTIINCRRVPAINPHRGVTLADRFVERFFSDQPSGKLLDIHGAQNHVEFDIALGTGLNEPNVEQLALIKVITRHLQPFGLRIVVNWPRYSAKNPQTLTRRALDLGGCAMQMEIVRRLRNPNDQGIQKFLAGMLSLTAELSERR